MNKLDIKLSRWMMYGIYVMFLLTALNTCQSCRNSSINKNNTERLDSIDSTLNEKVSSKDMSEAINKLLIQYQIEGLKASKRTLYDENAVIRTAVRPDDRMNAYDQEIEKLEKLLK